MKCVKCNKDIVDGAKFCNYCGAPQASSGNTCPHCGAAISVGAKFCRACGTKLEAPATQPQPEEEYNVFMTNRHVTWKILPGQLAVKIDEQEMANYKLIKGVYVAPGTTALFFVNGKFAATLESGTYSFDDYSADEGPQSGPVLTFMKKIARHIMNGAASLFHGERSNIDAHGNKVFYSVVLVKGSNFPLIYELKNVSTKNLRSDIGLHVLCQITNLNSFFADQLSDKKFVAIESFSESIKGIVSTVTNQVLSAYSPEDIYSDNARASETILAALQAKVSAVYPYISVAHIINLSAQHQEIEKLRALREELYISEQELIQLQARNDFKNRLQNEDNRVALQEARTQADFEAAMNQIDKDRMLNQDSRDQFVLALSAERALREARTQVETDSALRQLVQTDLLSQEELMSLEAQIKQRLAISELDNAHVLKKKQMLNKMELDGQQLDWDIAIGNKRLDNDIWRQRQLHLAGIEKQRLTDEYADSRRDNKFEYEMKVKERTHAFDEQVRSDNFEHETKVQNRDFEHQTKVDKHTFEMETLTYQREHDLEKDKMAHKMEMLRQAEALRREREAQNHQQEMDKINAQNAFEMGKITAQTEVEKARIEAYANMTAEQIMAANPDISPEVAKAIAEKYKAEAAMAQNNAAIEMMQSQQEKLEKVYAQNAQDMKEIALGQMQLSRDIAQMQTTVGSQRLAEKEAETMRVREDAERHQDRMLAGVTTTVESMGNAKMSVPYIVSGAVPAPSVMTFCTNCGEARKPGTAKCTKCGHVEKD